MSYQASGAVLELPEDLPITTTQRFVLLVLASYSDDKESCFPSVEKIRKHIGVKGNRTVQDALRALEKAGLLRTEKRFADNGRQRSNRYFLVLPRVQPTAGESAAHRTQEGASPRGGQGAAHRTPIPLNNQKESPEGTPPIVPQESEKSGPPSWKIQEYTLPRELVEGDVWLEEMRSAAISALQRWLDYRKLAKRKAYVQSAWITEAWNHVEKTPRGLIAAIDTSIAREWQGIFEDGNSRQKQRQQTGVRIDVSKRKYQVNRAPDV